MSQFDNSETRFSARADMYERGRPDYPHALLDWLSAQLKHQHSNESGDPQATLAEYGAGTGVFTRQLIQRGLRVFAVEPNPDMRSHAEQTLQANERCRVFAGSAEQSELPESSVEAIVAAQAFHWFDPAAFRRESLRVLKPGGFAAMIWNDRRSAGSDFAVAYEAFVQSWGTDYSKVSQSYAKPSALMSYFAQQPQRQQFAHQQILDKDGLIARLVSCSYIPRPGQERYDAMYEAALELFSQHATKGQVVLEYDCTVYSAKLN